MTANLCSHFGVCGGCSKQNVPYDDQLKAKESFVRSCLSEFSIQQFHSILPSPDIFFYRNKMEYSFGDRRDNAILNGESPSSVNLDSNAVHLGLHPKGRFALVTPTPDCQLLSEESRAICETVADWATSKKIPVYVRKSAKGDLRHLVIREGKNTGERMVNLISKSTTAHVTDLVERLEKKEFSISTFIWTAYDGLSDVAGGDQRKVYWGDGFIHDTIGCLKFKVNPASFMQTNTRAAEKMMEVLRTWIGESNATPSSQLIDLYCGSGAIGLSLADLFAEVIGVEVNRAAIEDAEQNKQINRIANAHFLEGRAEELAPSLPVHHDKSGTTLIVDPPRAGLHPKLIETLLQWNVPQIFYVSCNPESLARDLRALTARYDILATQPMDFFPHTDHVETLVRLQLRT